MIEELDLIEIAFGVQIHNLPLEMITKSNVEIIGGKIGRLMDIEDPLLKEVELEGS